MEKETPLPYKIKFELETEEERTFLRIALQKAHACAFGAIMDSKNDSELDEKTKQFNIERFSREMRLYARLLARLADATDEAEPWRAAGGREVMAMEKGAEKVEFIDTKKITSELLDVLSRHDLAVADAIRMLEMTKNKILVDCKCKLNKIYQATISVEYTLSRKVSNSSSGL